MLVNLLSISRACPQQTCSAADVFPATDSGYLQFSHAFSSDDYWIRFQTYSTDYQLIYISPDDSSGATLQYVILYKGNYCDSLSLNDSISLTHNDTVICNFQHLDSGFVYFLHLKRLYDTLAGGTQQWFDYFIENTEGKQVSYFDLCTVLQNGCNPLNLVSNGDFSVTGANPPATAYFSSDYVYYDPALQLPEGGITMNNDASVNATHWWGMGLNGIADKFLLCNAYLNGMDTNVIWESTVTGLEPFTDYYFSFYVRALGDTGYIAYNDPNVRFYINGNLMTFSNVYSDPAFTIPASTVIVPRTLPSKWFQLCGTWATDTNTTAELRITMAQSINAGNVLSGDDLGIDKVHLSKIIDDISIIPSNTTVCADEGVFLNSLLTVSGGIPPYNYQWSNGFVSVPSYVFPPFTTTYYVSVTDSVGCMAISQLTVSVTMLPDEINGPTHNCDTIAWFYLNGLPGGAQVQWSLSSPVYGNILWTSSDQDSVLLQIAPLLVPEGFMIQASISADSCSAVLVKTIFPCCCEEAPNSYVFIDDTLQGTIVPFENVDICIQGSLYIDTRVEFGANTTVTFGPDSRIIIGDDDTLVLGGNVILGETCGDFMWDGIYVTNNQSLVKSEPDLLLGNATVKNAKNAIVSKYGGNFDLVNIDFLDNYIGIKVTDYFAGIPSFVYPHEGSVRSCNFSNQWPDKLIHLLPFIDEPCHAGIFIENVNGISIGDPSMAKNNFSYLQTGIKLLNSKAVIRGNSFHDIPVSNTPTWPPVEAAVHSMGLAGPGGYVDGVLTVGQQAEENDFAGCYLGVYFHGIKQSAHVMANRFTDCVYPVYGTDASYPVFVMDNIMTTYSIGTDYPGVAITVKNGGSKFSKIDLRIINNNILGMRNGINISNHNGQVENLNIAINNIVFYDKNVVKRFGINVEHCYHPDIWANYIHQADPPDESFVQTIRGIRISESVHGIVNGNFVHFMGSGIYTNGLLLNTQFICNVSDSCYHGFFFGPGTALSYQGLYSPGDNDNNYNQWIGEYDSPTQSKVSTEAGFMLLPGVQYLQDSLGDEAFKLDADITDPSHPCHLLLVPIHNQDTNNCIYFHHIPFKGMDSATRESYFGDILRSSNEYLQFLPEYRSYEQAYFHQYFSEFPGNLYLGDLNDAQYQQFFDSLCNSQTGYINTIKRLISENKIDSAVAMLQLLDNSDQWMENYQVVYTIYLNTWARNLFDLSTQDRDDLMAVALQTPYEGGEAVYTARLMLNIDPEDYYVPYRSPEFGEGCSMNSLKIRPNPASSTITIEIPDAGNEFCQIEIFNETGKLLTKTQLPSVNGLMIMKVDNLKPGFYLIYIHAAGLVKQTGKLIIIK
ncbi:MAG TPA: T9SS type A sorting domain-containing protein [Bacteroidales bacterium]|nr:T9SS type A sorting domain-containing protein [Bacteroidales bacterium]HSA42548.1 T9SS type A sorting domain-containing protein [Bacteroidales bacterium]